MFWRAEALPYYKLRIKHPTSVFFVFPPETPNLGDHAIAFAIEKLLNEHNIPYIVIPRDDIFHLNNINKLNVFNGRTIVFQGGGFIGDIYPFHEALLQNFINSNPKSNIIFFPNTAVFFNEEHKQDSKTVYNKHKKLKFYLREKFSYDVMKDMYPNVSLCPDVVLSLKEDNIRTPRNGCLLSLRNDTEKTMSSEEFKKISFIMEKFFGDNVKITDTFVGYNVNSKERENEINKKLNEFRNAKLVITDRMHGMVFCAITATPCIVMNSLSHKIRGTYEWIKDLEYIKFCENVDDLENIVKSIPNQTFEFDNSDLLHYYDELISNLKDIQKK